MSRIAPLLLNMASVFTAPIYGGIGHVLMYHRVNPQPPERVPGQAPLEVSPEQLENNIRFFQERGYDFLSLDELHQRLSSGNKGGKFAVFTFDDGYKDNLAYAYPIFKRHNIPFAIYIATSMPDRTAILWWYLLDELILSRTSLNIHLPGEKLVFDCSTKEGKIQTSQALRRRIKFASHDTYQEIIARIFSHTGIDLHAKTHELTLSWEQIRTLSQDPLVTIGSHSVNHNTLKNLPPGVAEFEIKTSRMRVEENIEQPVWHFAYPFGEKNEAGDREFAIAKKIGFRTAVTTRFANIFPQHVNHLTALPRFDMPSIQAREKLLLAVRGLTPMRRNRFRRVVSH